jgi:hypothetical protein
VNRGASRAFQGWYIRHLRIDRQAGNATYPRSPIHWKNIQNLTRRVVEALSLTIRKMPSLTVGELISEVSLGLRLVAGEAGQAH